MGKGAVAAGKMEESAPLVLYCPVSPQLPARFLASLYTERLHHYF